MKITLDEIAGYVNTSFEKRPRVFQEPKKYSGRPKAKLPPDPANEYRGRDLTGIRIGGSKVLRREHGKYWRCLCDCGDEYLKPKNSIVKAIKLGSNSVCPECRKTGIPKYTRIRKLIVLQYVKEKRAYLCKCACGSETYISKTSINRGKKYSDFGCSDCWDFRRHQAKEALE